MPEEEAKYEGLLSVCVSSWPTTGSEPGKAYEIPLCGGLVGDMIRGKLKNKLANLRNKLLPPTNNPTSMNRPKRRQEWSIGIYIGKSPFHVVPPPNVKNPVLTRESVSDAPAKFVADPFMLKVQHSWYMFFEVLNRKTNKGEIALATSKDGMEWIYQQVVLAEPFHLSYPYVFNWMDHCYMIPESYQNGSIRLYKAVNFPTEWVFLGTLISGPLRKRHFTDASIFRHGEKWWLFTETDPQFRMSTLRLYYADDLLGPWHEHRKSPIIKNNNRLARPAGRVLAVDNKLVRYAQDCYPVYGTQVRVCEIVELTDKNYREREMDESPILTGSGIEWNSSGMHHIDPHPMGNGQWIACVDGWMWVDVEDGKSQVKVEELKDSGSL